MLLPISLVIAILAIYSYIIVNRTGYLIQHIQQLDTKVNSLLDRRCKVYESLKNILNKYETTRSDNPDEQNITLLHANGQKARNNGNISEQIVHESAINNACQQLKSLFDSPQSIESPMAMQLHEELCNTCQNLDEALTQLNQAISIYQEYISVYPQKLLVALLSSRLKRTFQCWPTHYDLA